MKYNAERKKRYIEYKTAQSYSGAESFDRLFRKSYDMETELCKDVCDFTLYEILEMYKMLNTPCSGSLQNYNSNYKAYTQWCLEENLVKDNQNHFNEVNREKIEACVNKGLLDMKILTREQLLNIIDDMPWPREKFVILGVFEGLGGVSYKRLLFLRPEHVDFERNLVNFEGETLEISEELKRIIIQCIEEEHMVRVGDDDKEKTWKYADDGYVFKQTLRSKIRSNNNKACVDIVGRSILDAARYLGLEKILNSNGVVMSGKIHMINTESKKLGMTALEYLRSPESKKLEKYFGTNVNPYTFIEKYKKYLNN